MDKEPKYEEIKRNDNKGIILVKYYKDSARKEFIEKKVFDLDWNEIKEGE